MPALAMVVLPHKNGLPKDSVVNTLWFTTPGGIVTFGQASFIAAIVADLYSKITPPPWGLGRWISPEIDHGLLKASVRIYESTLPPGSPPVHIMPFTLAPNIGGETGLPGECAVVTSFRAAPPYNGRRRGRIFIGPWALGASVVDVNGSRRPDPAVLLQVSDSMKRLRDAAVDNMFAVYSRANGTAEEVVDGWTDDSFDTQRRRGLSPTSRSAWS